MDGNKESKFSFLFMGGVEVKYFSEVLKLFLDFYYWVWYTVSTKEVPLMSHPPVKRWRPKRFEKVYESA